MHYQLKRNHIIARVNEIKRFVFNGLIATGVHYASLLFFMEFFELRSVVLANITAALLGITVSFIGSRYYVFRNIDKTFHVQFFQFSSLYLSILIIHTVTLYVWSEIYGFDYKVGFFVATSLQVFMSYIGNKLLVFK